MSLELYRGGTKDWTDGQILEIYNAVLPGDSALAYAGTISYLRLGLYLAAVDTDAPYNRRLLEMHDAIYEPAHTPPFEFRAGAANKTLDRALVDSGYPGPLPAVLSNVDWAISRSCQGSTSRIRTSWPTRGPSEATRHGSKGSLQAPT